MATGDANPFADFDKLSSDLYGQWEQGMTAWWDQVLDNPAFLGAMGGNLSSAARARQAWEEAVDSNLEKAHLPTRKDLVRVARIATLIEERLLQVEDRVLAMQDKLDIVEKEALRARIDAAETRVQLLERFDALEAKLAELAPKPARKSRAKKGA